MPPETVVTHEPLFNHSTWAVTSRRLPDEAGDVDVREGGHQVLAVESVHDAAVSGDGAGKVLQQSHSTTAVSHAGTVCSHQNKTKAQKKRYLYFEGSLEAAGEEATEGPDERRKGGEEDAVDLEGVEVHRFLQDETPAGKRRYFHPFFDITRVSTLSSNKWKKLTRDICTVACVSPAVF